ncbi:MAG: zinc ribbon domain-containing protein [Phycisphaeraceae bacterium]|nr:zinc ribbon domain-containing protein [Phycisphaeraceae bacterium]
MPIYEYQCEADGTVIELMRPMSDADKPVSDPAGKGRRFTRKFSTFAAKGAEGRTVPLGMGAGGGSGGGCACGKPHGGCGSH